MVAAMGMATDDQLSELGRLSGRDAEVLYLQLMYRHHQGGLEMAQAFLDRSDEPDALAARRGDRDDAATRADDHRRTCWTSEAPRYRTPSSASSEKNAEPSVPPRTTASALIPISVGCTSPPQRRRGWEEQEVGAFGANRTQITSAREWPGLVDQSGHDSRGEEPAMTHQSAARSPREDDPALGPGTQEQRA